MTTQILIGNALDVLRGMEPETVHCVITSVPYWGLRSYGTKPQVWGGKLDCDHHWTALGKKGGPAARQGYTSQRQSRRSAEENVKAAHASIGERCERCMAWRGEHGQEPTFALWLQHEVLIFREVKRVLRKDGTLFLNIGDAYATTPNGRSASDQKAAGGDDRTFRDKPNSTIGGIFKPKDRLLMPPRLAIALQEDGWWVRDEIIWHKLNPMPSSVNDRTCPAHEMVYHLVKSPRYFYDYVAIQEEFADDRMGRDYKEPDAWDTSTGAGGHGDFHKEGRGKGRKASERNRGGREDWFTKPNDIDPSGNGGKLKRSVWPLALEPFPDAHFATFPTKLIEPMILAGTSAKGCCVKCAAPWRRITEKFFKVQQDAPNSATRKAAQHDPGSKWATTGKGSTRGTVEHVTIGWYPTCKCFGVKPLPDYPEQPDKDAPKEERLEWKKASQKVFEVRLAMIEATAAKIKPIPATVLDPFGGAGTTGLVADMHGRNSILIELNPAYAKLARDRIRKELGQVKSELADDTGAGLPLLDAVVEHNEAEGL